MAAVAGILAWGAVTGPAAAENHALKEAAKKTEQGFGSLLKGIGHAAKSAGEAVGSAVKKKDDKAAKPKAAEQDRPK